MAESQALRHEGLIITGAWVTSSVLQLLTWPPLRSGCGDSAVRSGAEARENKTAFLRLPWLQDPLQWTLVPLLT